MTHFRIPMPLALLACACSGSAGPTDAGDEPPPAPENGIQVAIPEQEIAPGEDRQFCWYTTFASDEDVWISGFRAFQPDGGHHIIAFRSLENVEDGTVIDCTDGASMALWMPLLLAQEVTGLELPEGYGIKVPARAKLVFQSHYVNTYSKSIKTRDYVNIHYAASQTDIVGAAPFANSVLDLDIPPATETTLKYRCAAERDMNVFSVLGHMHEHGIAFSLKVGPAGAQEVIYDYPQWDGPGWRDTPPVKTWPLDAPLVIHKDDLVDVSCTWSNPTSETLSFPQEMCASLIWFFPAENSVVCGGQIQP